MNVILYSFDSIELVYMEKHDKIIVITLLQHHECKFLTKHNVKTFSAPETQFSFLDFTNNAEFWLHDFESDEFEDDVQKLWNEVEPLYMELHAYVRYRLRQKYGENIVPKKGAIPSHLLGK